MDISSIGELFGLNGFKEMDKRGTKEIASPTFTGFEKKDQLCYGGMRRNLFSKACTLQWPGEEQQNIKDRMDE